MCVRVCACPALDMCKKPFADRLAASDYLVWGLRGGWMFTHNPHHSTVGVLKLVCLGYWRKPSVSYRFSWTLTGIRIY